MTAVMGIYLFKFAFRRYGLKAAYSFSESI